MPKHAENSWRFHQWKVKTRLTYVALASRCEALGCPLTAHYLKLVAIEWIRTPYDVAKFLSHELTGRKVPVEYFMEVAPRRPDVGKRAA